MARRRRGISSDPATLCDQCYATRDRMECAGCGTVAHLINCGHYPQPRPIAAGKVDGSDLGHAYCVDCAKV